MSRDPPVLSPQITNTHWDVIVIGAGPAGALAAILSARGGLRVLLVEKKSFPRDKVCGGCVNGEALGVLERCGLIGRIAALRGKWIERFELRALGRELSVPLSGGVAVSRSKIDQALVADAVESGVRFLDQTQATVLESSTPDRELVREVELRSGTSDRRVVTGRVVVAADGLGHHSLERLPQFRSHVHPRSYVGLAARTGVTPVVGAPANGTISLALGRGGYVGLVRDETESIHLAAAVSPNLLRNSKGPADCVAQILRDARCPLEVDLSSLTWQGTGPLTQSTNRVADRRLFVVGDAVRYIEPFTGEGIAWALAGAERLAPLLSAACSRWDDRLISVWNRELSKHRRWPCRLLTGIARFPQFARLASWGLSHIPSVPCWLAGQLDRHSERTRKMAALFNLPSANETQPPLVENPAAKDAA